MGCSLASRTQWSSGVGLLEEHFCKFDKLSKCDKSRLQVVQVRNLTNCPSEASLEVLHDISKLEGFTFV